MTIHVRSIDRWFIDEVLPHARAYRRQARRWADEAGAEDIVQDAYARVIAMTGWAEIANPKAYVMLAIRNIAIDRLRQARVIPFDRGIDSALLEVEDEQPDALTSITAKQELERTRAAIEALPPQCRRVVEMRKLENCPPREIADRLGISVSTVEKHLVKGLRVVMATLAAPADIELGSDPASEHERRPSGDGSRVAGPPRRRNG